jgi:hypothetical protein
VTSKPSIAPDQDALAAAIAALLDAFPAEDITRELEKASRPLSSKRRGRPPHPPLEDLALWALREARHREGKTKRGAVKDMAVRMRKNKARRAPSQRSDRLSNICRAVEKRRSAEPEFQKFTSALLYVVEAMFRADPEEHLCPANRIEKMRTSGDRPALDAALSVLNATRHSIQK